MPNPLAVALKGKGLSNLIKRSLTIGRRYGITPARMDHALGRFAQVLEGFDCNATFPLTACTLTRGGGRLEKYQERDIEFAIHGYHHVDYSQLVLDQQLAHLGQARQMFEAHQLSCVGFRAPYLRYSQDTLVALDKLGFSYDSSQALAWDVKEGLETEAYHRALDFYRARSAEAYVSVPRLITDNGLVQIPYSLPDDEALVERLRLDGTKTKSAVWVDILRRVHALGELFVLGLHPERIAPCEEALRATLAEARALSPPVWVARLDEIADWWRARTAATYQVTQLSAGTFRLVVDGPPGLTLLSRGIEVEAPSEPWFGDDRRVLGNELTFQSERLPFIGVSPDCSLALASFLRQQGYLIVQEGDLACDCVFYLEQRDFGPKDERALLRQLEGNWPLLRLARWPDGAQCALSITGDIDALTLRDYTLRVFNR
jgi:peptidoglycan/xylan/chitin deacetylase (PgdA/CDA1 family)